METCYLVTPTAALPGVVPVVPRYRGGTGIVSKFKKRKADSEECVWRRGGGVVEVRPCDGITRPAWAVHAPDHAASDCDEFECEEEDEPSGLRLRAFVM